MGQASSRSISSEELADALLATDPWLRTFRETLLTAIARVRAGRVVDAAMLDWGEQALAHRRSATLGRLKQRDDWLKWARCLRGLRQEIIGEPDLWACISRICQVDLRSLCIEAAFDASGLEFPTCTAFDHATFAGEAWLSACTFEDQVSFAGAIFEDIAVLERSNFLSEASFVAVKFRRAAELRSIRFCGRANFERSTFYGDAWLAGSRFCGCANFAGATFHAEAGLGCTVFDNDARFVGARFHDNAGFEGARFDACARFGEAFFAKPPRLTGAAFCVGDAPSGNLLPSAFAACGTLPVRE